MGLPPDASNKDALRYFDRLCNNLVEEVRRLRDRVQKLEKDQGPAPAVKPSKPIQSAWSESERVSPSGEEYGLPTGDAALLIGNMMKEGAVRQGRPSPISEAFSSQLKAAAAAFRERSREDPEE